jgi:hypothetical protein
VKYSVILEKTKSWSNIVILYNNNSSFSSIVLSFSITMNARAVYGTTTPEYPIESKSKEKKKKKPYYISIISTIGLGVPTF